MLEEGEHRDCSQIARELSLLLVLEPWQLIYATTTVLSDRRKTFLGIDVPARLRLGPDSPGFVVEGGGSPPPPRI